MPDINFHISTREPKYPVIVISSNDLYSVFDIEDLFQKCVKSTLSNDESYIKAIDSSGEEFRYIPEHYVIAPHFFCTKWTKKQIVELYNESLDESQEEHQYSTKSFSAKRIGKIVSDICKLLKE
ncbi:MAG: hypothetical protein OCC45_15960 [Desulfotalea sp.]